MLHLKSRSFLKKITLKMHANQICLSYYPGLSGKNTNKINVDMGRIVTLALTNNLACDCSISITYSQALHFINCVQETTLNV